MKKYLIISATILLLAAGCSKTSTVTNPPVPTPTPVVSSSPTPLTPAGWKNYTTPQYNYFIAFPSDFSFSLDYNQVKPLSYIPACDQDMVGCAYYSATAYKGTNFDSAGVSVNIDPTLNTEADCYNFAVPTNEAQTPVVPDITINGTVFKSATGGDAGAGHFAKVQVYRNFHNNQCFEIDRRVGYTDIGNYPTGTVSQFDENGVWQKLQDIINTFVFTK
jgi:hypothetical protein